MQHSKLYFLLTFMTINSLSDQHCELCPFPDDTSDFRVSS